MANDWDRIALLLFLTTVETFIAVTALVAIGKDLGHFDNASWILASYQLGYVAIIVIAAKISDICGRKPVLLASIVLFTALSGGCGAAQSMTQLIILRAVQGIGAGGCFALCAIIMVELVPPEKLGGLVAKTGVAIVMAMVLGPLIGGTISDNTTWRWIFLFNVPAGAVGFLLVAFGIPDGFPKHQSHTVEEKPDKISTESLARIDALGFILLMLATTTFTAGFQEADGRFPWASAYVLTLLIGSAVLWAILLIWERHVTIADAMREPVLPWRFFTNRVFVGLMLGFVLVGGPMAAINFQLPQRFQLINKMSSFDAGVRIIPYGAAFPVGSMVSAKVASRFKVPGIYFVFAGSVFQIIGYAMLSTLGSSVKIDPGTYGYEFLCGLGSGTNYQILYLMVPFTAEKRDHGERPPDKMTSRSYQNKADCSKRVAVGMGAANQFRYMGSAFALAIVTSVFNGYTGSRLEGLGVPGLTQTLVAGHGTDLGDTDLEAEARRILSGGYNRQMLVLCGFAVAQVPAALLMWRKKQVLVG
ncbi:unnamed protein product [Clonostachys solani]|uniref:Major facilitator superfamily (MFS) profile domain-containing protein n=1 Tax=Clonostachys solani TaxID=160281 RepID=A0A9N9ZK64_9HYPO|nr:unnamed protein product [Clonostachys solani]